MINKLKAHKTLLGIVFLGLVALFLPIIILLARDVTNLASRAALPSNLEAEIGVLSSNGVSKQSDSQASGGQYIEFAKSTSPTPSPSNKIYGPGINIDSKSNRRIGDGSSLSDTRGLSHRFRASTTSRAVSLSWELRLGDGYSKGDGGTLRISIQTDDGSANHFPSGQILDSYTFRPGNDTVGGGNVRQNFPGRPLLNEGQLYHIVFENIHSDPVNNYISVNEVFTFKTYNPRQPNLDFSGDYAVIDKRGNSWSENKNHTAQMDLAYEDGTHDGLAYSQAHWNQAANSSDPEQIGIIEAQRQAREIFTVQGGNKIVTAAYVRVAQEYGTSPLTISLKTSSGSTLRSGTVPASSISDYAAEIGWYDDPRTVRPTAGDWVSVTFNSPITLTNGSTYQLVMTAPSGTKYAMVPIRYGTWDDVVHESFAFREGKAQQSNNGGSSWENVYAYQPYSNYQFYFTLQ